MTFALRFVFCLKKWSQNDVERHQESSYMALSSYILLTRRLENEVRATLIYLTAQRPFPFGQIPPLPAQYSEGKQLTNQHTRLTEIWKTKLWNKSGFAFDRGIRNVYLVEITDTALHWHCKWRVRTHWQETPSTILLLKGNNNFASLKNIFFKQKFSYL